MQIDMATLLFGGGFALFIALLAWGNQIREPRKEITTLEEKFRNEFRLKKSEINPIIKKSYETIKDARKYNFMDMMESFIIIMDKGKLDDKSAQILSKFRELNTSRQNLERLYNYRYFLTIVLTITLFILGFLSLYHGQNSIISNEKILISFNVLYMFIVFIVILVIILNLVYTYSKENSFVRIMMETDELIEVN